MKSQEYHFFYRTASPFSQWHQSQFSDFFCWYDSAEQYMMMKKAALFDDTETFRKIAAAKTPREQKALGRQVKGFNPEIWDEASWDIVFTGNFFKFTQNKNMYVALMTTGDKLLVEASPTDRIWGIGYSEKEALDNRNNWGQNKLGRILTKLRNGLRKCQH